jgi:hypothetical protein
MTVQKHHNKKKTKKTQKYTNPSSIPKKKKTKITKDDPRNTDLNKEQSNEIYDIVDDDYTSSLDEIDISTDFWDENNDPDSYYDIDDDPVIATPIETMSDNSLDATLSAPTNLYIDPNSYQLENNSANSDGSVRWVAYLYFDDVEGAESYEYVLNASAK